MQTVYQKQQHQRQPLDMQLQEGSELKEYHFSWSKFDSNEKKVSKIYSLLLYALKQWVMLLR